MSSSELIAWYQSKNWEVVGRMKGLTGKRFIIASARGSSDGGDKQERYFFVGNIDAPDDDLTKLVFSVSNSALSTAHVKRLVGADREAFLLKAGLMRVREALSEDETPRNIEIQLHSQSPAAEFRVPSTSELREERKQVSKEILEVLSNRQFRGQWDAECSRDELLDEVCTTDAMLDLAINNLIDRRFIEFVDKDGGMLITSDGEDELSRIQSEEETMSVFSRVRDIVDVVKPNGERHSNLKASVDGNRIYMEAGSFPITRGDMLVRRMSNGQEERYEVLDPGFQEKHSRIPAHYQMKIKNLGLPEAAPTVASVTNNYHLIGNNSRVNHHSTDNSTNLVHTDTRVIQHLESLRSVIRELSLPEEQRTEALATVDDIETEVNSGSPRKRMINALLKSLPQLESVASIAASLSDIFK
jgi:hypothetical protein